MRVGGERSERMVYPKPSSPTRQPCSVFKSICCISKVMKREGEGMGEERVLGAR